MGHGGDGKAVFDGYAVIEGVCLKEWGVFWIHEILLLISEWLAEVLGHSGILSSKQAV